MPVTYGNTAFDDARDKVCDALDALGANMVSNSVVPRFAAISSGVYVHRLHLQDVALTFNTMSAGISEVTHTQLSPGRIEFMYRFEVRILTGNVNSYFDEELFYRLANSVINWLFAHLSLGSGHQVKPSISIQIEPNIVFSDTMTRGGRVLFTTFGVEEYTQA